MESKTGFEMTEIIMSDQNLMESCYCCFLISLAEQGVELPKLWLADKSNQL